MLARGVPGNVVEPISALLLRTLPSKGAINIALSISLLALSRLALAASKVASAWASCGFLSASALPEPSPTLPHSLFARSDSALSLSKLTSALSTFASAVISASS